MRIEYDTVFIKLLAKEVVKVMRRTEQEKPQPELISSKEAAALIGVSEDYVQKSKTDCHM